MEIMRTELEQKYLAERKRLLEKVRALESIVDDFPMYIRRQDLSRYLTRCELFKHILDVKGSIIECGVHRGASLMLYAQLSAIFEPYAFNREIIGFDSFEGFVGIDDKDGVYPQPGALADIDLDILEGCIHLYDLNRPLGHIPKVCLVKGDATETIPKFFKDNPHVVVALLYLDFDLHSPTKIALESIVPRMPKGAVIAFDELNNQTWPGETTALLETSYIRDLRIRKFHADPHVSYAILGE